ncbi:hypothetical protein SAMN04488527_101285 [Aliiroseovarius crassostreae]|uniref:DNA transposition protein n=1 Tax=Aliiroseovarius crassostreae TaxID=154981 RepID=A0A0P7KPJ3_9RHOB|nr:AAA family ATPase [Aliiroseovarius crassostreae]KPN64282.1 hypothetical protein AKJ29_16750 [Aliiroseovarius crassostreae]SFU31609.1 hypothetical protein SAMN04488527_101285 [Aliiroseovarius crassostreae]
MNAHMETGKVNAWPVPKGAPDGVEGDLLERWNSATHRVAKYAAENGWSKSEVARRSGVAMGTLSGWYDGTYKGRYDTTTQKMENWLAGVEDAAEAMSALPVDPGFVQTRVARELFETFTYAQALPTMAVATIKSGFGKTCAAEHYAATRPHVFHLELSPSSHSPHTLKIEIGELLGLDTCYGAGLKKAIVEALKRDGFSALLIIDEAQYLNEDGINELRHFHDRSKCGLVLLGNDEKKTPYANASKDKGSAQIARRVGNRLSVMKPYAEDIETFLNAWGIEDPELRKVGTKIAQKPGALGSLIQTLKAASMIANGMGVSLTPEILRAAYERRGEGVVG